MVASNPTKLCECGCGAVTPMSKYSGEQIRFMPGHSAAFYNRAHGMSFTPAYRVWRHMLTRCSNPNTPDYRDYGERGIKVCERWKKFANFLADMGQRPSGMSIDRIDNNRNYELANCRWATNIEQANNKRSNVFITHEGESLTLPAWGRKLGLSYGTLLNRYQQGDMPPRLFRPLGSAPRPRPKGLIYKNSRTPRI